MEQVTKEELRDIYFGFYDQLNEPERSEAKDNWDYEFCPNGVPNCVRYAIAFGFDWKEVKQKASYWDNIDDLLLNKTYEFKIKANNSFFKEITEGICELLEEKDKRYGSALDNPLEIFAGKSKFGVRIDEKLSRIKNSETLRLNDVCDTMGYLTHLIREQGWTKQDILNLID
jgi:hypothetical protein